MSPRLYALVDDGRGDKGDQISMSTSSAVQRGVKMASRLYCPMYRAKVRIMWYPFLSS